MTAMAILTAMVFEKRVFCRYACLVGRVSGMDALFSPVELRSKSRSILPQLRDRGLRQGQRYGHRLPTRPLPGFLQENTYCTLCTECIGACPHDNLDLNMRAPATDLLRAEKQFRWDEAIMALVLLARDASVRSGQIVKVLAYAVIPVALFYYQAHNGMHFFGEPRSSSPC